MRLRFEVLSKQGEGLGIKDRGLNEATLSTTKALQKPSQVLITPSYQKDYCKASI